MSLMKLQEGLLGGRVDQIGIIVPDLESAMDAYIATLGVPFQVFEVNQTNSTFSGSSPEYRIRIAIAQAGLLSVELIQPAAGVTLYSRHLEAHGPGVHHMGIYVDSLAKTRKALAARGYRPILDGKIRGLGKFSYLEAPDMHCILEPLQLSLSFPLFLARNATQFSGPANSRIRSDKMIEHKPNAPTR